MPPESFLFTLAPTFGAPVSNFMGNADVYADNSFQE